MKRKLLLVLLLLSLLQGVCACDASEPTAALELHFLDVGQGDAILLRTEEGDVLIDAGSEATQDALCLRLSELGVESLRLAVFTHADEDHLGGADGVLRAFSTDMVWITRFFDEDLPVTMLRAAAKDTGSEIVEVFSGMFCKIGGANLAVFSPYGSMESADGNDSSIVLKVSCGDVSALLMGDASEETERMLLSSYGYGVLRCDILKAGHHGANTSTCSAFLQVIEPDYAVISCGEGNFYGHPHGEVLARLEQVGAEILRTDLLGDIVFLTNGKTLWRR